MGEGRWGVPTARRGVVVGMRLSVVDGVPVNSRDSLGDEIKAFRERHMHDDQPPRIPFEVHLFKMFKIHLLDHA